jgi:hypothetical protein
MGTNDATRLGHLAVACLLLAASTGPARAQDERAALAPPAAPGDPAPLREAYVLLFGGPAFFSRSEVQATNKGILVADVTVQRDVAFRGDAVAGLRAGAWLHPWLGVAMELATTKAAADLVELRYTTLSLIPMARLPLLASAGEPHGRLYLYAGLPLSMVVEGQGTARFPELGHDVSGSPNGFGKDGQVSLGVGALVGVGLNLGPVVVLLEQRVSTLDLTFSQLFQEVRATVASRQTILGAAARF